MSKRDRKIDFFKVLKEILSRILYKDAREIQVSTGANLAKVHTKLPRIKFKPDTKNLYKFE